MSDTYDGDSDYVIGKVEDDQGRRLGAYSQKLIRDGINSAYRAGGYDEQKRVVALIEAETSKLEALAASPFMATSPATAAVRIRAQLKALRRLFDQVRAQ